MPVVTYTNLTKPPLPIPGGLYTIWRLLVAESFDANYVGVSELNFRRVAGVADSQPSVGSGAYAASSALGGYPPSNAFDGDVNTAWFTEAGQQLNSWIQVTYQEERIINQLSYTAYPNTAGANQAMKSGKVQYKNGAGWIDWIIIPTQAAWSPGETRLFTKT